jgi:predicted DNA-binding transcriptional regulator YafY
VAKGSNQKLKLLHLAKIFFTHTDDLHGLTVPDMIHHLAGCDIAADRKTIYADLNELRQFGLDIVDKKEGRNTYYRLASRDFELAELKLLVDLVQSSKFLTERKSRQLIKKLEGLGSVYDAKQLHRQVILTGRVKTINETIYYSVDTLHAAIEKDSEIQFQYYQWNTKKEQALRHGGAYYIVSPWALLWDEEYYYLIGYDAESGKTKHYRVDKMLHITLTNNKRQGREIFETRDLPKYSRGLFGMFGGEEETVTLRCENWMAGAIIDRFGKDITLFPVDDAHFSVHVQVSVSPQFLGWVFALGSGVKITAPPTTVEAMRREAERLTEQYNA